jgi:hypothetical protein
VHIKSSYSNPNKAINAVKFLGWNTIIINIHTHPQHQIQQIKDNAHKFFLPKSKQSNIFFQFSSHSYVLYFSKNSLRLPLHKVKPLVHYKMEKPMAPVQHEAEQH